MTQLYKNIMALPAEKQKQILLNSKRMLEDLGEVEFVIRWFAFSMNDPIDVIHGYLVRLRKIRILNKQ